MHFPTKRTKDLIRGDVVEIFTPHCTLPIWDITQLDANYFLIRFDEYYDIEPIKSHAFSIWALKEAH